MTRIHGPMKLDVVDAEKGAAGLGKILDGEVGASAEPIDVA